MEENNRPDNSRDPQKKPNGRTLKRVIIALLLIIAIPAAAAAGYSYYLANQIESHSIDDSIWDKPLEDPIVSSGESTLPSEDQSIAEEDAFLIAEGVTQASSQPAPATTEEGYIITDHGTVITDMGEFPTDIEDTDPQWTTPGQSTPGLTTPDQANPGLTTPGQSTPGQSMPGITTPDQANPGLTTPGQSTPGQSTPGLTTPDQANPGLTTPGQSTPGSSTPGQSTPGSSTPSQSTPGSSTPSQSTPGSSTPGRTTPSRTTPGQTTPGRTTPSQTTPEYKPPTNTNSLGIEPEVDEEIKEFPVVKSNRIKNILLLGVDSSTKYGRSDSIMILSVDQKTKKIKLSSIMRDSYVYIDGRGMDKINHAYAFGGARLALKTVNSNFKMNIKDFAVVNFAQMPKIVNYVGGVSITLTAREAKYLGFKDGAGVYQLDGAKALRYSRIRKMDSDFVRTSRQRSVLRAVLSKLMTLSPGKVPGAAKELLPMIRTTLSANEIISTGIGVAASNYTVVGRVFPPESASRGAIIKGIWYLKFDRAKQARALHNFIFN